MAALTRQTNPAVSDPDEMRAALAALVERTGFEGIAPLPKEARNAVATARALPRLVEYGEESGDDAQQ